MRAARGKWWGWTASVFLAVAMGGFGCGGSETDVATTNTAHKRPDKAESRSVASRASQLREQAQEKRLKAYLSKRHGRPLQWELAGPPKGSEVTIQQFVGLCVNPPVDPVDVPQVKEVRQVGKPKAVILTLIIVRPKRPMGCLIATLVGATVHIRGGLRGRPIYDGSQSPPEKRWPRSKHD